MVENIFPLRAAKHSLTSMNGFPSNYINTSKVVDLKDNLLLRYEKATWFCELLLIHFAQSFYLRPISSLDINKKSMNFAINRSNWFLYMS